MFRYPLALLLLCWAAASAPAASWADALFDEFAHDFGSVPHGSIQNHSFRLTNRTAGSIHISQVRVSCGCTGASAHQTDLAPGQSTVVRAQMDTGRFFGVRKVTIFVDFDQPQFEEVQLSVQADSRDDVTFTPEALAFGRIKRGSTPDASLKVTFMGNGQWQVLEAKCDSNYVQPRFQEVQRDASQVTYEVTARMRPDTPAGTWYSTVWLTTNNPAMPQFQVPLTVEIESPLSITPSVAELGEVKAGAETQRRVIVRGDKPFRITEVKGTDDQVSVQDSSQESKPVHILTIRFKPSTPGELSRTFHVMTDLMENSDVDFQATARVVP